MSGPSVRTAPMSYTQEQLWIAEQLHPGRGIYTESVALRLTGAVDPDALETALGHVLHRHEILRTVFPVVDDRPVQQIIGAPSAPLTWVELGDLPAAARGPAFAELARQFVEQPADLAAGPLFRCLLVSAGEQDHALILALHHLVSDGWSAGIVVGDLASAYDAALSGHALAADTPALQFADFAVWERQILGSGLLDADRDGWLRTLADAPAVLELWPARERPETMGVTGRRVEYTLDACLGPDLTALCRRHGASTFVAATVLYAAVVSRWTGQDDFVVGTLVANRARPELESVVGQFANTVPLRLDSSDDPTFEQLLLRCRDRTAQAIERGGVPLEWIVAAHQPQRSPGRNALIQHLFLAKESPARIEAFGSAKLAVFEVPRKRGRLDTIIEADIGPETARIWVEYDTALFTDEVIDRFVADFGRALAAWAARPQLRVSELPTAGIPGRPAGVPRPGGPTPGPGHDDGTGAEVSDTTGAEGSDTAGAEVSDGPLVTILAQMWAEIMSLDTVRPSDDFFELGGHSMLASRLVQRLRDTLDVQLPLRTLFESPTLGAFGQRVRELNPGLDESLGQLLQETGRLDLAEPATAEVGAEMGAEMSAEPVVTRLSTAQLQLWMAEQLRTGQLTHTIPLVLTVDGELSPQMLVRAVNAVVARHDGLRVTFEQLDGTPVQRIAPRLTIDLPLIDLAGLPAAERDQRAGTLRQEFGSTAFDLTVGPLLAGRIVRLSQCRHEVQLAFHHLLTDEVSMTIFARELSEFYRAELDGRAPALPPLTVTLADYVRWESGLLSGPAVTRLESFWRRQLRGAPILDLGTDHPRPAGLTFEGTFLSVTAAVETFHAVARIARQTRTTSFVVYTAAVAALLHRHTGSTDVVIGVPCENRVMAGSEHLIGCFLNVLPVRIDCAGDPRLVDLAQRVHEALIAAYDHQSLPLARIVEAVRPGRETNRLPLFQITCELQLGGWLPFDFPGATVRYEFIPHGTARYDLAFHAMVEPQEVFLGLELNTNLWDQATGYRLLGELDDILRRLARAPDLRLSDLSRPAD